MPGSSSSSSRSRTSSFFSARNRSMSRCGRTWRAACCRSRSSSASLQVVRAIGLVRRGAGIDVRLDAAHGQAFGHHGSCALGDQGDEPRAAVEGLVFGHEHPFDRAVATRGDLGLHLHAFDDEQRLALVHGIACRDHDLHDGSRHRRDATASPPPAARCARVDRVDDFELPCAAERVDIRIAPVHAPPRRDASCRRPRAGIHRRRLPAAAHRCVAAAEAERCRIRAPGERHRMESRRRVQFRCFISSSSTRPSRRAAPDRSKRASNCRCVSAAAPSSTASCSDRVAAPAALPRAPTGIRCACRRSRTADARARARDRRHW